MYGWTNDAGEPIMDGAAYRFEQQLDHDSAMERWGDGSEFYDYDDDEPDWCHACGAEIPEDEDESDHMCPPGEGFNADPEDSWLDGSYEE